MSLARNNECVWKEGCVCVCVFVIILALLPFRGKMCIFFLVRRPRLIAYCELQTLFSIQIQQEWKSWTWVHYTPTLPNSLALLSVYIHPFIYNLALWLDIYCKHCWSLEQWWSSLTGDALRRKARGTWIRSLSSLGLSLDFLSHSLLSVSSSLSSIFLLLPNSYSKMLST